MIINFVHCVKCMHGKGEKCHGIMKTDQTSRIKVGEDDETTVAAY